MESANNCSTTAPTMTQSAGSGKEMVQSEIIASRQEAHEDGGGRIQYKMTRVAHIIARVVMYA